MVGSQALDELGVLRCVLRCQPLGLFWSTALSLNLAELQACLVRVKTGDLVAKSSELGAQGVKLCTGDVEVSLRPRIHEVAQRMLSYILVESFTPACAAGGASWDGGVVGVTRSRTHLPGLKLPLERLDLLVELTPLALLLLPAEDWQAGSKCSLW